MWIYRIWAHENKAILEDEVGFYIAQYEVDYEKKSLRFTSVIFESTLVTQLETLGDDPWIEPARPEEYERIYTRDAIGMESYPLVQETLLRFYFPLVTEIDDKSDHLVLVRNKKGKSFTAVLQESFDTERHIEICTLTTGNSVFLGKIIKPLNSVLLMYYKSATNPTDLVASRLAFRFIFKIKEMLGLNQDDGLTWSHFKESKRNSIDESQAKLYVLSSIVDALRDSTSILVKDRCQLKEEDGWLKVEVRSSKKFDLSKFKNDHPDLYEEYLADVSTPFLVRQGKPNASFPLNDDLLKEQIGNAFKVLS